MLLSWLNVVSATGGKKPGPDGRGSFGDDRALVPDHLVDLARGVADGEISAVRAPAPAASASSLLRGERQYARRPIPDEPEPAAPAVMVGAARGLPILLGAGIVLG